MGVLVRELRPLYRGLHRAGEPSIRCRRCGPVRRLRRLAARVAGRRGAWSSRRAYWREPLRARRRCWSCRPTARARPSRTMPAADRRAARCDAGADRAAAALSRAARRDAVHDAACRLRGAAVAAVGPGRRRDRHAGGRTATAREVEGLIGFFVNTLALRLDLSGEPTLAELLARVRRRARRAQIIRTCRSSRWWRLVQPRAQPVARPLFQVMFAWQNAPEPRTLDLPGLARAARRRPRCGEVRSDAVSRRGRGGIAGAGVRHRPVRAGTIERQLALSAAGCSRPWRPSAGVAGELPLLPSAERRQLL